MTPDTIALARAIGKLPGAPTLDVPFVLSVRDRETYFRDDEGIRWIDVAEPGPDYEFVLDLEDAATGGAMLWRHLQHIVANIQLFSGRVCVVSHDPDVAIGPTLGIALARLIIARGGWNV